MSLEEKQRLAVRAAQEFWNMDIGDPSSKDRSGSVRFIDSIIRTKAGLDWGWDAEYKGDGDFPWCGAFESWAIAQV